MTRNSRNSNQQQQQEERQHRRLMMSSLSSSCHYHRTPLVFVWVVLVVSVSAINNLFAYGWVNSNPYFTSSVSSSTSSSSTTTSSSALTTAVEPSSLPFALLFPSPIVIIHIEENEDEDFFPHHTKNQENNNEQRKKKQEHDHEITITKDFPSASSNHAPGDDDADDAATIDGTSTITSTLPWIVNHSEKKEDEEEDTVFLSHWEWQLSYFKQHLTNFRINTNNNNRNQDNQENDKYSIDELMYIDQTSKNNGGKGRQRIYTVSYTSDEYRDIRLTYMILPGSQFFRCLCYPQSSSIPILGMGLMKFGIGGNNTKNMAVLDYQPLPTTPPALRTTFETELQRLRTDFPSMTQPMSTKHFESNEEERKYFTNYQLIGKWDDHNANDNDDDEHHRMELIRAQQEYVKTHIQLTQQEMQVQLQTRMCIHNNNNNDDNDNSVDDNNVDDDDVIQIHSDFDTFVSLKEPAGKVLCGALGKELGTQVVHRVIFPLSRNS
eukprot:CAMPEP_0171032570 /NCGR_PEP_ID=MMETSP0736-20130129/38403_1 /TAXON_ID=186038 /ORGANISM="Fragilariopsis kerguelensis, Strain L26-C5" /LENGTH=492 /DNA_ID=CAMNT_0011475215 /DNA_START=136 /DNA_END=1614 /DNA_ORIENTATION=+